MKRQPIEPEADHDHGVARLHAGPVDRPQAAGQRLHERGLLVAEVVGDAEGGVADVRRRNAHVLGEPAGIEVGES